MISSYLLFNWKIGGTPRAAAFRGAGKWNLYHAIHNYLDETERDRRQFLSLLEAMYEVNKAEKLYNARKQFVQNQVSMHTLILAEV